MTGKQIRIGINMSCVLCQMDKPEYYVRGKGQCCYQCMIGATQLRDYPLIEQGLEYEIKQGHVIPLTNEDGWTGFIL